MVRGYLEQRFALPAGSLTTRELEAVLAAGGSPARGQAVEAGRLLRQADRFKFSGERPPAAAAARALREAEALVAALEQEASAADSSSAADSGGAPGEAS